MTATTTSLVIDFPEHARAAAGTANVYEIDIFIDRSDPEIRQRAIERHGRVGHATRQYWIRDENAGRLLTQAEAEDLALDFLRKVESWEIEQFGDALPLRARVRPKVDVRTGEWLACCDFIGRDGKRTVCVSHYQPDPGTWGAVLRELVLDAAHA